MPKAVHSRRRASISQANSLIPNQRKSTKSIACQRCHTRKVKCSGGHPCSNCRDAGSVDACVYPLRDRQVKLSQQYVEDLLQENERLRASSVVPSTSGPLRQVPASGNQETVQNPLVENRPQGWFFPMSSLDMPIHISEAADAAFATRFRETMTPHSMHIPRTSYVRDDALIMLSESRLDWPTPARSRFLVKVALSTVCQYYHIVLKSSIMEALEKANQNVNDVERLMKCKLLALFALGEVYSSRVAAQEATFPGLSYFAQARRMVSIPAERPTLHAVEIALLLGLYSFNLNRRHMAYLLASSAVRLGIVMGLNLNVPDGMYSNPLAREHRKRLWWTAYTLDRTCCSKLGHSASITDEDIMIDHPSSENLGESTDFEDAEYAQKSLELAGLSQQTRQQLYSRRKHHVPFAQRVQTTLKNITRWMETLPPQLQLESVRGFVQPNSIVYLHLRFNQCCIIATRPILLHVLRVHCKSWTDPTIDPKTSLPESALTLAETCIQCSRHSCRLLNEAWIRGSFAIFDYFYTQYLFSAATNLALSSLLGSAQSQSDSDNFSTAIDVIRELSQMGNFAAKEFLAHLDAIEDSMQKVRSNVSNQSPIQQPAVSDDVPLSFAAPIMTAGMALAEPSLQEFLADTDLTISGVDNPTFDPLQTPYWPGIWGADEWANV